MAELTTVTCDWDNCESQKRESNRWFQAYVAPGRYFFVVLTETYISPPQSILKGAEKRHYCSESCLIKAFSKSIGKRHPAVLDNIVI
jgi:hypothetical protein